MIPQKIQLKNFISYGPTLQTIDFSSYNLICLSGKNGHGKSALLDAMTWAIWGQARKVSGASKADQGLLRLGQTQMLVIFDFEFGDKFYRIRREYMETFGKPITSLEFGMVDTESDTFIPLTDKTIRTTQEKIEQTLRLDFDSFSNSAFLRQGSSNEFSKKSPKDRKQILATILGLDQYEVIRKLALEKVKEAQTKKLVLVTLQQKREQELTVQEKLDAELATIDQQMLTIKQEEIKLIIDQNAHTQNRAIYDEQQKQFHNLSFQLQQLTNTTRTQQQQLREILAQWRAINKKKQSLHSVHQLEQEKNKIVASIADHQKLFQQSLEHKEALLNLTQELHTIEQQYKDEQTKKKHALLIALERLIAEQKNQENTLHNYNLQIKQYNNEAITVTTQKEQYEKERTNFLLNTQDVPLIETHLEKRKAAYQHFVSLGNWVNSELNSLANKKKLVHEDDPSCPLCEQNLSASRRRFLKHNFEKQESFLAHRLKRLKRIIPLLKEILIQQHAQLVQKKEALNNASNCSTKIDDLTAQHTKITVLINSTTATTKTLNSDIAARSKEITDQQEQISQQETTNKLATTAQYTLLLQQKALLDDTLKKHSYNEVEYTQAQKELKRIELQLTDYEALQKDVAQQESRKNDIAKLCTTLKQLKTEYYAIDNKKTSLGNLTEQLLSLQKVDKHLEDQRAVIKNNKEILLHNKGSIENQHNRLATIKKEYQQEQANVMLLEATADDYYSIATATGKDGIQALLIEDAIPEIEQEANYLLSRLTNNQAQIFIESLRDLKKGGTKETLDIKISDQAGIRPYELFSGGEAFRIDFALRIAISKLLARRAGTALQTLIIDEGFGSQDEEGLSHIMDALHKIQDDFSKIIIVSHLPAMKDQFPVQFVIEKGVQGSTVTIVEQG